MKWVDREDRNWILLICGALAILAFGPLLIKYYFPTGFWITIGGVIILLGIAFRLYYRYCSLEER